jgi:hypothetical protein
MPDIKNNPVINAAAANAEAVASNERTKLDILKQLDVQDSIASASSDSIRAIALADKSIKAQGNAAEAEVDAQNAAARVALASSWTDQGSKSNYWAAQMHENATKAYASLDVIKKKQAATLLDDPLGFIEAQFTLPADIDTHNYYAEKHNIAESSLNQLTQATNAAAIANSNMKKRTSLESAEAELTKVAENANLQLQSIRRQSAGDRISGLKELNSLTQQQSNLAYQALSADNEQKRLAIAQQSAADQHAQRMMMQADRAERMNQKEVDRNDLVALMDARNLGAKQLGKVQIDNVDLFRREYMAQQKNSTYQDMVSVGQQIQNNRGNVDGISLGQNAGSIARNYASPGTNLTGNVAGTYLAQVYDATKVSPAAASAKDPVAFNELVNTNATRTAKLQLGDIKDDLPNIYKAPPPSILTAQVAVKSNPFIVDTVLPMVAVNPNVQIEAGAMMSKASDFSKTSSNINVAAAGVASYYKQAVLTNNLVNRYKENGLPEQLKYMANIGGRTINLADELQVKSAIMQDQRIRSLSMYNEPAFNIKPSKKD